ncbi:uncharacterized protein LOC144436543 isoform X2 [Glandiceps talaboti]
MGRRRNKNKDQWQLLCAWDIDDETEEIGGLSISSWTKRNAKPKSAIDTSVSTSSTWQNYLCTTGTKCSDIDDIQEFVDASLTSRLKPRAHSAPEPQSRQSPQREITEDETDNSKTKQSNGISSSTKTFDQKRAPTAKVPSGTSSNQRSVQQTIPGNLDSKRSNSGTDTKHATRVHMSKSAVNVSRLQLTLKDHRHHELHSEEETYTVNGITGVKSTPRRERKLRQPHPNSASSFDTISESERHLHQRNGHAEQENLSQSKVKFSYTKSGHPGSTLTFLSDTTDSSEDRQLHTASLVTADGQLCSYYGDDADQLTRATRHLSEKKLRHMSHMFNMMESQNLSVADILNSTPRLERYISMQQAGETRQSTDKRHERKQNTYGYELESKRFGPSENALPPVNSQSHEHRQLQYTNKVQDRTRNESLPRVSPTSKLSHEAEPTGNGEFHADDSVRGGHEVYDEDEDSDILIRDGMDFSRLTEKHRGPPGFRANTAKNPLSRARETTQKKLCTQLNARNITGEGSIAYAPAAEETATEDAQNHRWQSSLHYLYDMNKSHMAEVLDPRVQTLTESLDRGEPYQRTAGLKLSRRKKSTDFNQLTIGDRTFTVAEFTASAAARAANTRKKIATTK